MKVAVWLWGKGIIFALCFSGMESAQDAKGKVGKLKVNFVDLSLARQCKLKVESWKLRVNFVDLSLARQCKGKVESWELKIERACVSHMLFAMVYGASLWKVRVNIGIFTKVEVSWGKLRYGCARKMLSLHRVLRGWSGFKLQKVRRLGSVSGERVLWNIEFWYMNKERRSSVAGTDEHLLSLRWE